MKKSIATLEELTQELHDVFSADSVDVDYVEELMSSYKSNPLHWKRYAKFDRFRYTRNLVDEGNGKFNLMILCWGEGHSSAIHDHSNAHCFMKILQGSLSEVRYAWPDQSRTVEEGSELKKISENALQENEVCYINDSLGLHRVENLSHTDRAVSLHLYCPPFDTCNVFNQRTGNKSSCRVTFWSKYGDKRNKDPEQCIPADD